jgi:hypothetical protein
MEEKKLETILLENDNETRGPCSMPEPWDIEIPLRPDFMHVEKNPDLENISLTFRWLED